MSALRSEAINLEARRLLSLYYRESLEALARLAYQSRQAGVLDLSKPISWSDFPPERRREVEVILQRLHRQLSAVYEQGTRASWTTGEVQAISHARTLQMTKTARGKVNASNLEMLQGIRDRRVGELTISQKVWGHITDARDVLSLSLQSVLGDPKASRDPKALSRAFLDKLQNPDGVVQSLREGNQHEELQRAQALFGKGTGVYRDPIKNVERLFRTEITKANREAQWLMYQQNPYVTGFEIRRSNRRVDGKPLPCPLCDKLQGVYPKTFKFTVWHPHCECIMIPIFGATKDPEFVAKVNQTASRGGDAIRQLENPEAIEELPKGMLDFASRIQRQRSGGALLTPAGKVPALFIQENAHLLRPHFNPSEATSKPSAPTLPAPQPEPAKPLNKQEQERKERARQKEIIDTKRRNELVASAHDIIGKRFRISPNADVSDLEDNIRVSRALLLSFDDIEVKIRKHVREKGNKNPEFLLNGLKADNKRIQSENGVKNAFQKGLKQGCEVIIIDLDAHLGRLRVNDLAKYIARRNTDLPGGINKCYVVFRGKAVLIDTREKEEIIRRLVELKEMTPD